jgi:hypothetical protein
MVLGFHDVFAGGPVFTGPLPPCRFAALFFAATILAPRVLFAIFVFPYLRSDLMEQGWLKQVTCPGRLEAPGVEKVHGYGKIYFS